ncbi:Ig-like domain-containing protein [Cohnella cholangitidis]|uniref:SbsA Ig-like domain-containing protein n=1 Tax=Cohnella cholangitidis TaxID=2598458 RepID=A0A7G5BZ70_9BACL|nr:Ig-like domain-containing protein [Cohnella cholangitidis]QMV42254.1 hypothetical protein FPL14_14405 [Cohnella cholangitidis]
MNKKLKVLTYAAATSQVISLLSPYVSHATNPFVNSASNVASSNKSDKPVNVLSYSLLSNPYPKILQYLPLYSGIPVNANLVLAFDTPMQLGNGSISIVNQEDNSIAQSFNIYSGMVRGANILLSGNNMIIDPGVDLFEGSNYYVLVSSGALVSTGNIPFSGITSPYAWTFRTQDTQAPKLMASPINNNPPMLASVSPEGNNAAIFGFLRLTLDKWVELGNGYIYLYKQGEAAPVLSVEIINGVVTAGPYDVWTEVSSSTTVSVVVFPFIRLEEETSYYVQVTSGAIVDTDGRAYAGISDTTTWDFTTMNAKPSIDYAEPTSYGTSIDTDLFIWFSEAVQLGNGLIEIRRQSNGSVAQTIEVANGTVTGATAYISGNVVTIDPDMDLEEQTDYYVTLESGTFVDLDGVNFSGVTSPYGWTFRTKDNQAPSLVSVSPEGSDASISGNLAITFDENVTFMSGYIHLYKQGEATPVLSVEASSGFLKAGPYKIWMFSGTSIFIDPNLDLEKNASYYVQITSGAIADYDGNAYAGFSDTTTWDFTTMDERPVINYLGPTYSGVSANADLYIEFNEPVQLGNGRIVIWRSSDDSIAQTIEIANGTITGATAQIFSGSVTIDPDLDLAEQSEYYVTMTSGTFTDLNGSISYGIATTYDWRFTTGDFTAPGLVRVSPEGSDASISGNLAITFDENVQLINGYIHLYKQGKQRRYLAWGSSTELR